MDSLENYRANIGAHNNSRGGDDLFMFNLISNEKYCRNNEFKKVYDSIAFIECILAICTMQILLQREGVETNPGPTTSLHQCYICDKVYSDKYCLKKHIKNVHHVKNNTNDKYECHFCTKNYTVKINLEKHMLNKHINKISSVTVAVKNIKCPLCQQNFYKNECLQNHLKNKHTEKLEYVNKVFENKEAFYDWKNITEQNKNSQYIRKTGRKTNKNGVQRIYFVCCRSGSYESSCKVDRKKRLKSQGSRKINSNCPSIMNLKIDTSGLYHVVYQTVHLGHNNSLGHLSLSSNDRTMLAGRLAEGVPVATILDDVQALGTGTEFHRIHLANYQDLQNILRDYDLRSERQHKNDAVSVDLWVKSMEKLDCDENPILFYKPQGVLHDTIEEGDFIISFRTPFPKSLIKKHASRIICIDSTHDTNDYFLLSTLMTVDEFGAGMPIAFCLSNRKTTATWEIFISSVKNYYGLIECDTFMSDDDPAFYNAWKNVMGSVERQLLCIWHVKRNLFKQLNDKCKLLSEEKKKLIKQLINYITTIPNRDLFIENLNIAIHQLLDDSETKAFGEYFRSNYATRTELWALCYRLKSGINTNMYLEALHKSFKYFFLEGRKNKRVDKCIFNLFRFCRRKVYDRLIRIEKNTPTSRVRRIRESHDRALLIQNEMVIEIDSLHANKKWRVKSQSHNKFYEIIKCTEKCPNDGDCRLCCPECGICVHQYDCECEDFTIRYNICKHIHAVQLHCKQKLSDNKCVFNYNINSVSELVSSATESNHILKNVISNDNNNDLISKAEIIIGMLKSKNYTSETKKQINTSLDKIISLVKDESIDFIASNNENKPANTNILPQKRNFSSLKKQKNRSLSLNATLSRQQKHSFEVSLSIGNQGGEALNIHSSNDHSYASHI